MLPSVILSLPDITFIPRNNNPIGQSNSYLCVLCSMMMVGRYSTLLINDPEVHVNARFIMTVNSGESFQFDIEAEATCMFCAETNPQMVEEAKKKKEEEAEAKRVKKE